MSINIGIEETHRKNIAEHLRRLLADTYSLYLKSHGFHWNVKGPMFQTLHTMFETHYTELATAIDDIAERIRALDEFAPASYSEFSKLTAISEAKANTSAEEMIRELVDGHETLVRRARESFSVLDEARDEASADLITQRIQLHEKTAWMLRSLLA